MSKPRALTRAELRNFPLPPVSDGGKNERGRALVIAGCRQVPGSAVLAATAALRAGAGKVRIGTVASLAPALALEMPEVLVHPLAEAREGGFGKAAVRQASKAAETADAIVAGPGFKEDAINSAIAKNLVALGRPLALDAGMLRCLSGISERCRDAAVPPILLPHAGELASLLDSTEDQVENDPLAAAHEAARRYGAFVLAKGSQSHVAAPDGRCWKFTGGVAGLGIAGSGDTLAGIVVALLSRGATPLTALLWSVLLHGEAGESLARKVGPVGFLAREIPGEIPALLAR